jgi:transposase
LSAPKRQLPRGYTIDEAVDIVGVSRATIYRDAKRGMVRLYRSEADGRTRITPLELDRYQVRRELERLQAERDRERYLDERRRLREEHRQRRAPRRVGCT